MIRQHRLRNALTIAGLMLLVPLVPLAGAHYYEGPYPQDCPDDGQEHEHRWQDGSLYCRSRPMGCHARVEGIPLEDPFAGNAFLGPVTVTAVFESSEFAWNQPQVRSRAVEGDAVPGVDSGPVLVGGSDATGSSGATTASWTVMGGLDARAYDVKFELFSIDLSTGMPCTIELEWRQRN